jgi:hypothetical protein
MSKSRQKRRLIAEAVSAFKLAINSDQCAWNLVLKTLMQQRGWKVSHPGKDKYIAIKGPLVCKWIGMSKYRYESIKDILTIHRVFSSAKLNKFLPRLYVNIGNLFVIEQRCETDIYDKDFYRSQLLSVIRSKCICVEDVHQGNVGKIHNVPKVIDGHIQY